MRKDIFGMGAGRECFMLGEEQNSDKYGSARGWDLRGKLQRAF